MDELVIIKPDDFHLHLRNGENLSVYVEQSAACFARGLVMPNTQPPIITPDGLKSYENEIKSFSANFEPLMTFKINSGLSAETIRALKEAGAVAGKYYPAGVTTNSEDGMSDWKSCREIFAVMEDIGLVLCVHGELPSAPVWEQEKAFLNDFRNMVSEFPRLRIVLEHISTRESAELIKKLPGNVAATITVHHLLYTCDDLWENGFNPHFFCKPLLRTETDRNAIQELVLSGFERVFFGSDSAPHLRVKKESSLVPPGIFSAPAALPLLVDFFSRKDRLDRMEPFVSRYGAEFYGLPLNSGRIRLVRKPFAVPKEIAGVVPLASGESLEWSVVR